MLERLDGCDEPAERVADEHHWLPRFRDERRVERLGRALRRERLELGAKAVARQLDQHHAVAARQAARGGKPVLDAAAGTMQQGDGRAVPHRESVGRLERSGRAQRERDDERQRRERRNQDEEPSGHDAGRAPG